MAETWECDQCGPKSTIKYINFKTREFKITTDCLFIVWDVRRLQRSMFEIVSVFRQVKTDVLYMEKLILHPATAQSRSSNFNVIMCLNSWRRNSGKWWGCVNFGFSIQQEFNNLKSIKDRNIQGWVISVEKSWNNEFWKCGSNKTIRFNQWKWVVGRLH